MDTNFTWQPTASHECEQYQTIRKPTKIKVWSSGSPAMFSIVAQIFGFSFGFLNGFALLWGSPVGLFDFCGLLNGFHEFSLCNSMLSCLGQREGPRSWSGPQIRAPANILLWLAEGGNTCLKEVRDVRDDSKALIRTIAYCLNSNARLRPLRQCLLTMPYLRTTSGRFLSSEVWQRSVQFASGLSDMAGSLHKLNVAVPRV